MLAFHAGRRVFGAVVISGAAWGLAVMKLSLRDSVSLAFSPYTSGEARNSHRPATASSSSNRSALWHACPHPRSLTTARRLRAAAQNRSEQWHGEPRPGHTSGSAGDTTGRYGGPPGGL